MWPTIKQHLKEVNTWYDSQPSATRFWPWAAVTIFGLFMISSDSTIVTVLGVIYYAAVLVMRWMHVNGKL